MVASASASPRSDSTASPGPGVKKPRGRPARAKKPEDLEPKTPRKRGPKPKSAEEKAKIKEEKRLAKIAEREAKKKAAKKPPKEKGAGRGKGRRAKVLTEEDIAAREELKKQKYEEFKRQKQEKAEKRLERNAALREYRKAKKDEEKRKKEAFEKRMQALKASFLDENSHLSSDMPSNVPLDETSQSSLGGTRAAGRQELSQLDSIVNVTSDNLFEYKWPPMSKSAEHYFLQEQVCEYLGIKSFKRRYPTLYRYAEVLLQSYLLYFI